MFWVSACQDADKTVQNEHEVQQQGSVCVHINFELGHFFQTRKGLRQGPSFSYSFQFGGRYVSSTNRES
jgi:hypothetical protein